MLLVGFFRFFCTCERLGLATMSSDVIKEIKPAWIRPPQWSKLTGMSRTETYRLIYEGYLRAAKVGKMWFIEASELDEFFERMNEAA